MKRVFWCALAAALALSSTMTSCVQYGYPGSGIIRTDIRDVQPFTTLGVHDNLEFTFTESKQSSVYSVRITVDDNLARFISTQVVNGRLDIRQLQPIAARSLKIEISGPPLAGFVLSNRAKGNVNSLTDISRVNIELSNGGHLIIGNVECDVINAQLVTGGLLEIDGGSTGSLLLGPVSGNSKVRAENVRAGRVEVSLSAASTAEVQAVNLINASLTENSVLYYKGNVAVNPRVLTGNSRLVQKQ